MSISAKQHARLLEGLNVTARKVYDAVPKQEAWAQNRIHQELRRQGKNFSTEVVVACLDVLRKSKLINEHRVGMFQQTAVRVPVPEPETAMATAFSDVMAILPEPLNTMFDTKTKEATVVKPIHIVTEPPKSGIQRLESMELRMSSLASQIATLNAEAQKLAGEFTETFLEVQTEIEAKDKQMEAYKGLASALKQLSAIGAT